jgi:hypothetical protein
LTDDEDNNGREVSPTEQNLIEIEHQKKRRRTANYQQISSTKTTNGNHEDERISPPSGMSNYFLLIICFYSPSSHSFNEQYWIVIKSSDNR